MDNNELILLGKLEQAVENLTKHITTLQTSVDVVEAQLNKGKGFFAGVILTAGSVGGALGGVVNHYITKS